MIEPKADEISSAIAEPSATDRRRRSAVAAVLALVVGTVAVVVALVVNADGSHDDAFAITPPEATYTGFAVTPTSPDFFVGVDLSHPGSTVEIIDVAAHTSPNVEFLGAVTIWPRQIKGVSVGAGVGFPPADVKGTHPLNEPIPASETLFQPKGFGQPGVITVAAGFRLSSGEIGAMNGIRVVYKVNGKRTVKDSRQAGIACVKPKCGGGPTGSDDPNFNTRVLGEAGLLPKD
jgi:hypothetical protein